MFSFDYYYQFIYEWSVEDIEEIENIETERIFINVLKMKTYLYKNRCKFLQDNHSFYNIFSMISKLIPDFFM